MKTQIVNLESLMVLHHGASPSKRSTAKENTLAINEAQHLPLLSGTLRRLSLLLAVCAGLLITCAASVFAEEVRKASDLESGFKAPPDLARPRADVEDGGEELTGSGLRRF